MDFARSFPLIVQQRLDELGSNPFAIEQKAGLPADAIRNVLHADNPMGPRLSRVQEVCDALDLELHIGPRSGDDQTASADATFAQVPRLDATFAAGAGREPGGAVIGHLAFRRDWLSRVGVKPASASIVAVSGDSMAPALHDGDLALIDGARRRILPLRVYAFTDVDGQLRVKRLELLKEARELILRSDNTTARTEVRRGAEIDEVTIHGQVVWSAHTWDFA